MTRPKNSLNKNSVKLVLLKIAEAIGEISFDLLDNALLPRHYAQTHLTRELLGLNEKYKKYDPERRKKLFRATLHNLQKEGLVSRAHKNKKDVWTITAHGEEYVHLVEEEELPPEDGKTRIFSFDVPENEKHKRNRLRQLLEASDYKMLQKSLWVGRRPLPEKVIEKITEMDLAQYIHLFETSKKGTLKDLEL